MQVHNRESPIKTACQSVFWGPRFPRHRPRDIANMYSFQEHYQNLLARYYTSVFGGWQTNTARAREIFQEFGIEPASPQSGFSAADLGAGSGFYSVPLAQMGYSVKALDLDPRLTAEHRAWVGNLPVEPVTADIFDLPRYTSGKYDLILCMTDTIAHLNHRDEIIRLFQMVKNQLNNSGRFLISFRDQSRELRGAERYLPFYSDDSLIVTTILDFQPDQVQVTDLLHILGEGGWKMSVSSYQKIRLRTPEIHSWLADAGFQVVKEKAIKGMTYLMVRPN